MLDVYFAVRYLQLRDDVPDDGEDRTTRKMLQRLRAAGSIDEASFRRMFTGYELLRSLDHQVRLTAGRSGMVPPGDAPAFGDIARRLGYGTANDLQDELLLRMKEIREVYDCLVSVQ